MASNKSEWRELPTHWVTGCPFFYESEMKFEEEEKQEDSFFGGDDANG